MPGGGALQRIDHDHGFAEHHGAIGDYRGDRIAAVGTANGIPAHDACAALIDLRGRTVVPGLIDSHNHIVQISLRLDTTSGKSRAPFRLRSCSRPRGRRRPPCRREPGSRPSGGAPNQFLERRFPTLRELDAAAPNHQVYLQTALPDPPSPTPPAGHFLSGRA